jgi:hypothetical protein
MFKNVRLGLAVAMALSMILALGCGGVGAAPLNGVDSLARVAVSVSPQTMAMKTGATQIFTASVSNTSETGVGWLVNGFPGGINPNDGSSPFGTIDKDGNYTAPPFIPIPPAVTVTAVANADNNASANASVSISGTPSPISVSPLTATLEIGRVVEGIQQPGGITLFTATVRGSDQALNWLVENVPGGNANVGIVSTVPGFPDQVYYIAPAIMPGGNQTAQVHITAQSVLHPQETASAVVTLMPVPLNGAVVAITSPPIPPTVEVGRTQPFQASVTGVSDTAVTWEVDAIAGGSANAGTITPGSNDTAVYTAPARVPAPPSSPQVIVTAVSNAQPASQASIVVNLIAAQKVTVVLSTENCVNTNAIPINSTVQFDAVVTGDSQDVTWEVNKIVGGNGTLGTITTGGLYTAPSNIPVPATVVVSAVSVEDPLAVGNQPLTITLATKTAVQVSPSKASVQVNLSQEFFSTVLGLGDTTATWYVNGIEGGDLNTVGQITWDAPSGCVTEAQYVAPPTIPNPPTVSVTAVAFDGTSSPPATVTITPASQYVLHITPKGKVEVMVGQTQPYTATEDGDPNDLVTWSVSGQGCSGVACGTITPPGPQPPPYMATYTAPSNVPNPPTVTVTVSSVHHAGVRDTDEVEIQGTAIPSISILPTFQSVAAGQNQIPFQATIQNYDPTAPVQWQLGCISDWDGGQGDDCNDNDRDGDGPGCIEVQGGKPHCGNAQQLDVPGNLPLTYISPQNLFTNSFKANQCSGQADDGTGYLMLTVALKAQGCPGNPPTCTAIACVQVTP